MLAAFLRFDYCPLSRSKYSILLTSGFVGVLGVGVADEVCEEQLVVEVVVEVDMEVDLEVDMEVDLEVDVEVDVAAVVVTVTIEVIGFFGCSGIFGGCSGICTSRVSA